MVTGAFFQINKNNLLRPDPLQDRKATIRTRFWRLAQHAAGLRAYRRRLCHAQLVYRPNLCSIGNAHPAGQRGRPGRTASSKRSAQHHWLIHAVQHSAPDRHWLRLEQVGDRVEPYAGLRAPGYVIGDVALYRDLTNRVRLQLQVTNVTNEVLRAQLAVRASRRQLPRTAASVIATIAFTPFSR
jgi:hypothetical protein